jgi:hypothetical protein
MKLWLAFLPIPGSNKFQWRWGYNGEHPGWAEFDGYRVGERGGSQDYRSGLEINWWVIPALVPAWGKPESSVSTGHRLSPV